MYRTYQMYKPMVKPEYEQKSLEELAIMYQQPGANHARIFPTVFCRCFSLMLKKTNAYGQLTLEEKASKMTEKLHRCLMKYSKGKGLFLTIFGQAIENTMNSGVNYVQAAKRAVWLHIEDSKGPNDNDLYGPVFRKLRARDDITVQYKELLNTIRNSEILKEDEKRLCECVTAGCRTLKQMGIAIGKPTKDVKKLRESIKKKILASGGVLY